jgi:hypothetical protein
MSSAAFGLAALSGEQSVAALESLEILPAKRLQIRFI